MPATALTAPELMAPAGDWDCAKAAVANGADAVYFGLQGGLNARTRAVNFTPAELPDLMAFLRVRGVRGYLTLNTLVFSDELPEAERLARLAVAAGVDAVLVQDLGLLRLMHRLCPELPLHASTQMTLSSAECINEAAVLGVRRVVLPRELSIAQIAAIRRQTDVELEAFVHGALCISYSGQCLASLTFGGRSGNRGQCAQPCRLPYEVICENIKPRLVAAPGAKPQAAEMQYPLSPHDLAAYDRLPELIAAGVSALKIEGRLKPAEYVAVVTRHYRAAIDAIRGEANSRGLTAPGEQSQNSGTFRGLLAPGYSAQVAELDLAFSRGFCHGWLDGPQYRSLVSGASSAKRGTHLGEVTAVRGGRVAVRLAGPVRRGDGVVFEGDRALGTEIGGRVYEIFQGGRPLKEAAAGGLVELAFRHGTIQPGEIRPGQRLWKTDDPQAARRLRKSYAEDRPYRRVPVDVMVEAAVGDVLRVTATAATGAVCRLESPEALAEAVKHPLCAETLIEQFGRLGNTPYQLRRLELKLDGRVMVPLSVLGKLRREMVDRLQAAAAQPPPRKLADDSPLAVLRAEHRGLGTSVPGEPANRSHLHVLCRSMEQLEAALNCGVSSVIADFQDLEHCAGAVRIAHAAGATVLLATPRIHKPGESVGSPLPLGEGQGVRASDVFETLAAHRPDGLLVRNLAGLTFCRRRGLAAVADFSLNAANDLTVRWLHDDGAGRVTAAYDLSRRQLLELAAAVPPEWLEVVVHRHTPMFHTEYCLFCRTLSQGSNRSDCGRPCRRHTLRLRDRLGVEHPVLADSQCRNTVFHADAESLADIVPGLRQRGVRHFRIELATEGIPEEVRRVVTAQQHLIGG